MTWRNADGSVWMQMESPPGSTLTIGQTMHYGRWHDGANSVVFSENTRRDEDPRHQWSDVRLWCDRCDQSYFVLVEAWKDAQTPGWAHGDKNWNEVDPQHRTVERGRHDFENSQCEGERRKREEWGL